MVDILDQTKANLSEVGAGVGHGNTALYCLLKQDSKVMSATSECFL